MPAECKTETFQVVAVIAWKKLGGYTTKICHDAFRASFGEIRFRRKSPIENGRQSQTAETLNIKRNDYKTFQTRCYFLSATYSNMATLQYPCFTLLASMSPM